MLKTLPRKDPTKNISPTIKIVWFQFWAKLSYSIVQYFKHTSIKLLFFSFKFPTIFATIVYAIKEDLQYNLVWFKSSFHSNSTGACLMLSHNNVNNVRPGFCEVNMEKKTWTLCRSRGSFDRIFSKHKMKTTFQAKRKIILYKMLFHQEKLKWLWIRTVFFFGKLLTTGPVWKQQCNDLQQYYS